MHKFLQTPDYELVLAMGDEGVKYARSHEFATKEQAERAVNYQIMNMTLPMGDDRLVAAMRAEFMSGVESVTVLQAALLDN